MGLMINSFPHRDMDANTLAQPDGEKVSITYCDDIGCNGSTRGAWKPASAGYKVKKLIGALDFWRRDGHALGTSRATGLMQPRLPDCGC